MSRLNKKMTSLIIGGEKNNKEFKQAFEAQDRNTESIPFGFEEFKETLRECAPEEANIEKDTEALIEISEQLKSIRKQQAILHGERILRAKNILKKYKAKAFSSWILITYGNRQTPYNFLYYYTFYIELSREMKALVEQIPLSITYQLSSKNICSDEKIKFIKNHHKKPFNQMKTELKKSFSSYKPKDENKHHLKIALNSLKKTKFTKGISEESRKVLSEMKNLINKLL